MKLDYAKARRTPIGYAAQYARENPGLRFTDEEIESLSRLFAKALKDGEARGINNTNAVRSQIADLSADESQS